MNEQTFNRRLDQLTTLVSVHPQREELLQIMADQVADDTEYKHVTSQ
tara:strand:- start:290 stop:430 length:141 start_codon:yes stop_codon:yes gene_type:complete